MEPGADVPAGTPPGTKVVMLTKLVPHRLRKLFKLKAVKGESKTSVDPMKAMEASFVSQVRCRTARLLGITQVTKAVVFSLLQLASNL